MALTRAKPSWIAMTVKNAASAILQGKGCPLVVVLSIANCKLRKHKTPLKHPSTTSTTTTTSSPSSSRNPKPLARFGSPTCEGTGSNPGTLIYPHAGQQKNYMYMFIFFHPAEPYATLLDDHQTPKNQHILSTHVQIYQYIFWRAIYIQFVGRSKQSKNNHKHKFMPISSNTKCISGLLINGYHDQLGIMSGLCCLPS